MTRELITDLDDPRIAVYRALKATNLTRGLGQFVVEGEKLVERLLASRFPLVSILATDRYVTHIEERLPADVPVYVVTFEQIHAVVGFPFHRGVLACASELPGLRQKRSFGKATAVPRWSSARGSAIPRIWERSRGSATCSGSTRSWPVQAAPIRCREECCGSRWGRRCDCL